MLIDPDQAELGTWISIPDIAEFLFIIFFYIFYSFQIIKEIDAWFGNQQNTKYCIQTKITPSPLTQQKSLLTFECVSFWMLLPLC